MDVESESEGASDTINRTLFDSMNDLEAVENAETPAVAKYAHPVTAPFGQVSVCRNKEDTATIVALMIADQLEQTDDQRQKLVTALQSYFEEAGIENDSQLAAVGPTD